MKLAASNFKYWLTICDWFGKLFCGLSKSFTHPCAFGQGPRIGSEKKVLQMLPEKAEASAAGFFQQFFSRISLPQNAP